MGRKRTTPELQKLKAFEDSPDLADTKIKSSQKEQTFNDKKLANNSNSSRVVTRSRRCVPTNIGQVDIAEKPATKMDTEDASQKEASVLTPKMFYSKKAQKSAKPTKLSEKNEQDYIPSVKRSRRTTRECKGKSDSNNWSEPYSHDKNEYPVVPSKKISSKVNQRNPTNKKNAKNELPAHGLSSECLTVLKKQNQIIRSPRTESKTQMTTEEVISELTNDQAIVKNIGLPTITEKVNIAGNVNSKSRSITNKSISVKKPKVIKLSDNIRNKKQNVRMSLADIVNEISPDSPEKKLPKDKDTKSTKTSQVKNISDSSKKNSNDWDHSLLLITDDFNSSGNIYDFEEFQIDGKKLAAKNSSAKKFEKKKIPKKSAASKASKTKKELLSQRKTKKLSSKTSKATTNTKKLPNKRIGLETDTNPTTGPRIPVEQQENSISSCGISVTDVPFQTPSIQKLKEPVSITELEKFKATKRIENKIVSKVKPSLSSDWLQIPDLPSQPFTKLRRGPMEGPTASDKLPENKPKSMSIKTTSFNQSFLGFSSINSDSPAATKKPASAKVYSNKLSEKPALDNQPIDLFTYPIAMPTKKQLDGPAKPGKCKEVKKTPRKLMEFLYPGSVERYLEKPKENAELKSPPPVMLPKFLRAETSTPNTTANNSPIPKSFGGESVCISPVKDFLSPASMRTYEHKSRRNSSAYLSIIKNADIFSDEPKENLQNEKTDKTKANKKNGHIKRNKKFDEWANRMSNEFDEIEHFELSIET